MATAVQIISRSLRMLGVLAGGESPEAADANDALFALNAMLSSYVLAHAPGFAELDLASQSPFPATHDEGITALLALRLASEFGVQTTPEVQAMATRGDNLLRAYYASVGEMTVDLGLLRRNPDPTRDSIDDLTFNDFGALF